MKTVDESDFDPRGTGQFLIVRDDVSMHARTAHALQPFRKGFANALESISRQVVRHPDKSIPSIGVFHRSGDLRRIRPASTDERVLRTHGYGYFPPQWAADALRKVREVAGWRVPAVLSTEARDDEISPIVAEGAVTLSRRRSALADMLEMRHHRVLIMGPSSFPFWSWFLGDSFAVTPLHWEKAHPLFGPPFERRGWFVFEDETSLNDSEHREVVQKLLARQ